MKRRILHAGGDATGRGLILHMLDKVKNRVHIIENEFAIDLMMHEHRCIGVVTKSDNHIVNHHLSPNVILATGGCGGLYSFTSNDQSITGDGLAISFRAGAQLTDLEFIQFHPTLLNCNGKGVGLVSEAVRGEGAILVTEDGRPIMKDKHPFKDLAPRDIVARELYSEMKKGGKIYLDISMIKNFKEKFPTITELCETNGIHIHNGRIPVIPGAHFSMGGIKTDKKGRTSIKGLYAIGEVACTGVHGANRLASNSLLEGIVFGNIVANDILENFEHLTFTNFHSIVLDKVSKLPFDLPSKIEIQQMMMDNVGIIRDQKSLQFIVNWLDFYKTKFEDYTLFELSRDDISIINMIIACWLIATSALMRTESRGGHFREDFPLQDDLHWYKKEIIRTNEKAKVVN